MTLVYDRLSCLMASLPGTCKEIGAALDMAPKSVQVWARYLRAQGLVAYGPIRGRDGRVLVRGNDRTFPRDPEPWLAKGVPRFCSAWHALAKRCTVDDVAAASGIGRRCASEIVRAMRKYRVIREAAWEMHTQQMTPVYDRLPCPPVPRPARKPRAEAQREYDERRAAKRRSASNDAQQQQRVAA